jgi:hypothetical protein
MFPMFRTIVRINVEYFRKHYWFLLTEMHVLCEIRAEFVYNI